MDAVVDDRRVVRPQLSSHLLAGVLLLLSASAGAAESDVQVWPVVTVHHGLTERWGAHFQLRPRFGVGTHFFTNEYTIDAAFAGMASTYAGPVVIAQDLMVINVTPEQIVTRMAQTDLLSWAAPAPKPAAGKKPELDPPPIEGRTPRWVSATRIVSEN